MREFKTVSGSKIEFEAIEIKVDPIYEVTVKSDILNDTIRIQWDIKDEEWFALLVEKKLELKNSSFRKKQIKKRDKITKEIEAKQAKEIEKYFNIK